MSTAVIAEDYLHVQNFKYLIEWMTAEVILYKPDDPMKFMRDIIQEKIDAREVVDHYDPKLNTQFVSDIYTTASTCTDAEGKITVPARRFKLNPKDAKAELIAAEIAAALAAKEAETAASLALKESLIGACRNIANHLDPSEATKCIVQECTKIMDCERATLYKVDRMTDELVLMVAEGAGNIRVPMGTGVAGTCAATGVTANITDAYTDPRFNPEIDKKTGFHTRSILAMAVRNVDGVIVGVIEAFNKRTGPFCAIDAEIIEILASQAGVALQNAHLFHTAMGAKRKVDGMLDIITAIHGDLGVNSLIFTVTTRAHELVDADRCTLFIVDQKSKELWSIQGEVNIKVKLGQGIAGICGATATAINIPDAYKDPRFNQEIDRKNGFHTKCILCYPILDKDGVAIGVLQLVNKRKDSDFPFFVEADELVIETFTKVIAPILQSSHLFSSRAAATKKVDSGEAKEFSNVTRSSLTPPPSSMIKAMPDIADSEEEDDEEEEA